MYGTESPKESAWAAADDVGAVIFGVIGVIDDDDDDDDGGGDDPPISSVAESSVVDGRRTAESEADR